MTQPWSLLSGIALIRELLPDAQRMNWGLGLHGSVLYEGMSENDLDIIAYPMKLLPDRDEGLDRAGLTIVLENHGLRRWRTTSEIQAWWRKKGSQDMKSVEAWVTDDERRTFRGFPPLGRRRIDLFIMR